VERLTAAAARSTNPARLCPTCRNPVVSYAKNFDLLRALAAIEGLRRNGEVQREGSRKSQRSDGSQEHADAAAAAEVERQYEQLCLEEDWLDFEAQTENVLGGGDGAVYRATYDEELVAVKLFAAGKITSNFAAAKKSLGAAVKLRNSALVQFLGVSHREASGQFLVVTELMAGSLRDALDAGGSALPPKHGLRVALHVARGLSYLHACGVHHGNLKSSNVLLSQTEGLHSTESQSKVRAKLTDFRALLSGDEDGDMSSRGIGYIAPELFTSDSSSVDKSAADIYAFGVLLWEMASTSGSRPWHGRDPDQIYSDLQRAERPGNPWLLVQEGGYPSGFDILVEACWNQLPSDRPNVSEVVTALTDLSNNKEMSNREKIASLSQRFRTSRSEQGQKSRNEPPSPSILKRDICPPAAATSTSGLPPSTSGLPASQSPQTPLPPSNTHVGTQNHPNGPRTNDAYNQVPGQQRYPPLEFSANASGSAGSGEKLSRILRELQNPGLTLSQLLQYLKNPELIRNLQIQRAVCISMSRREALKSVPATSEKQSAQQEGLLGALVSVNNLWYYEQTLAGPCLLSMAYTIASNDLARMNFVAIGGLQTISMAMQYHERVADIQEKACYVLGVLAGFIGLHCCTHCHQASIPAETAWIESRSCVSSRITNQIGAVGLVYHVTKALRNFPQNEAVCTQALCTLRNLTLRNPNNADMAANAGVTELLAARISTRSARDRVFEAICSLLSGTDGFRYIVGQPELPKFIGSFMANHEEETHVQTFGLYAIAALANAKSDQNKAASRSVLSTNSLVDRVSCAISKHLETWKIQELGLRCLERIAAVDRTLLQDEVSAPGVSRHVFANTIVMLPGGAGRSRM